MYTNFWTSWHFYSLWFEVSVDDPLLVEVLQALDDLSSVVASPRLIKPRVVLIHIINVIPSSIRETVLSLDSN